jgi:osmotically inducible protein OsmC
MALSGGLEKNGTPATSVHTDAACTVSRVGEGFKITTMHLRVRASVPGMDDATFQGIAEGTKKGCPVSQALAGVDITLEAVLES